MWFSSYQAKQPEEFMGLYNSKANSNQGDDFQKLFRLADIYYDWQTGRKKVLGGRPLMSKKLLELQGLSPHAREVYSANLMSLL
jgi:hypothetical protein